MKLNEACGILFPLFLAMLDEAEQGDKEFEAILEWANATKKVLDIIYPADIFTGKSGDKGPLAIKLIRENLEVKQ